MKTRFLSPALTASLLMFLGFFPQKGWGQCTSDSLALVALYNATNGPGWTNKTNWLVPGTAIGTWYGVKTDPGSGCVVRLLLSSNNLQGTLPAEIGNFTEMDTMLINFNAGLTGSIPASVSGMVSVRVMQFNFNNLSGSIPSSIGNMTTLTNLGLNNNQLSGPIPPELGNLSNCTDFYLHENNLTGSIPTALSGLSSVQYFYLHNNDLSGSIPPELGGLGNCLRFLLSGNALTGSIPAALSGLSNVQWFWLHNNNLSGCIPPEIHDLCPHVTNGNISNNPQLATQSWANFCANHEGECCYLPVTATLSGTNTICNGSSTNLTFNFTNGTGPYDVVWSEGTLNDIPNGHILSVSPTTTTTYTISSVTDSYGCTGTSTSSVTVTVDDVIALGAVTGDIEVCSGSQGNYSVTPLPGVSSYIWTVPAGATILNQGFPSTGVIFGSTSGNVCVRAVSNCGTGPQSCLPVTIGAGLPQPDPITGATTVCAFNQNNYTIPSVSGATGYTWTATGGNIVGGQGTTTASVEWITAGTGSVCVVATGACGNSPQRCLSVTTVAQPTQPVINPGNFSPCQGSTQTYSVNAQTAFSNYQWTVPTGANITAGQGSNSVTVNWAGTQSGDLCVVATSTVCSNVSFTACQAINVQPIPAAPDPITGDATACVGVAETYSIAPVPGATSYNWTVPTGATIQSGQGTVSVSILWSTATTGDVCARAQNTCGNSAYTCLSVTSLTTPAQPGTIGGDATVCTGSTEIYTISTVSGATDYTWTVPTNASIQGGQGTTSLTVQWDSPGTADICVTAGNLCGTSVQRCLTVTTAAGPTTPAFDPGNNLTPCQNATSSYSIAAQAGVTYQWTAPAGANITAGQGTASVTINWAGTQSGNLCVTVTSTTCTANASDCQAISVTPFPTQPSAITGNASTCTGTTTDYSIPTVNGADTYTWTVPAHAEITAGQGTTTVSVQWNGTGSGNICVTASNTCGTSPQRCLGVTTAAPPASPDPISGNFAPCQNTSSSYSIAAQTGVTYQWTAPAGATITAGQGTANVTVNWAGASSGDLCVTVTSTTCGTASHCQPVTVTAIPAQPDPIMGAVSVCAGATETYTIPEVSGATDYTWTVPSNATIQGGQGTTSLSVQWNSAGSGSVCVTANNSTCNFSGPQRCLTVTTATPPNTPNPITGNFMPCQNASSSYSVAAQSGINFQWTVPAGANITAGQGTANVTVNWAGASSGDLCVTASSATCGGVSHCEPITIMLPPAQPDPISGAVSVCTGVAETYTIPEVSGATSYTWTVPANASIVSGQNTSSISVQWNTAGSGNVCVRANNSCGNSPQQCLSVTAIAPPTALVFAAGNNLTPCENTTGVYSVVPQTALNDYQWTLPPGATFVSGQGTPTVTINWAGASSGDLCVEASSAVCNANVSNCQNIDVRLVPPAPDPIVGPETVCVGSVAQYSIDPVPGATKYGWTVPAGASIQGSATGAQINVLWSSASTGKISVRAENTCGGSAYTELSVTAYAIPTVPVFLAGNFAPCENTVLDYGVTPQAAFDDYTWSYSNGGDITAGQGTAQVTVNWLGAGSGQLCVTASSSVCNVTRNACRAVTIKPLPAMPEYFSADIELCAGDTGVYVLEPVSGAISYNWVAVGGQFIGPSTGSTVKIKWPTAPVLTTMEVSANNSCGTGPINYAPTVIVGEQPAQPGPVSGPASVCQGSVQAYIIAAVPGAESYIWTVPPGAVIQGGQGTASVSIKFGALGAGNVCVRAKTLFCESTERCYPVTVGIPASALGPVSGPSSVCPGSQVVYSVAPVPGATGYSWTLPPGATFVGPTNTASVTLSFAANASSGEICVAALSACGSGAASCKPVAVGTSLTPSIGGATSFCTGDSTLLDAGAGYTAYTWAGPAGNSISNVQQVISNVQGTYTVTVTALGGCTGTASVTVSVGNSLSPNIAGPAGICLGGSATLDAGSGYANYVWAGPGSFAASGQLATADMAGVYTVTVSSANGCTGTATWNLNQFPPPQPSIVGPSVVCSGDTAWLDAGAGYAAYAWSNASTLRIIPVTSIAAYTVTVTDVNGCTGTDDQTVLVNGLPPTCQSVLTLPKNNSTGVPTNTSLNWKATPGCVDGYRISIGTAPGGSDILNNLTVTDTFYQPANLLPPISVVYVRIVPYNNMGEASGCAEGSFTTAEVGTCDPGNDSLALSKLYTDTDGAGWAKNDNWLVPGKSIADWYGVKVNGAGCVTEIDLSANKLHGILPELNLPNLQIFECDRNNLYGPMPGFIYSPKLKRLLCYGNRYTFEHILPSYANILSKVTLNTGQYNYFSQDSVFHDTLLVRNVGDNLDFSLDFDEGLPGNLYRWFQGNTPQPAYDKIGDNDLEISNLQLSHAGVWRVQVNNPGVPELTLYSRAIRLQVNCVADAVVTAAKPVLCPGGSVLLSAAPLQPGNTYAWYRDGSPLPGATGSTYTASLIGDYQVLVSTPSGCDSLSPVLALSLAQPVQPSADGTDGTELGCAKTTLQLSATGGDTYTWVGPNGFTFNGQQPTVNNAGTYTVTATSTATGCTGTSTVEVTQDVQLPTATATADTLSCKKTTATLTGFTNAPDATYAWSGPGGFTFSGQQPTVSSPGIYTLTVRDAANGCTNTATVEVKQNTASPSGVSATASGIVTCAQPDVTLQGNSITPDATYAWSGPGGFTANGQAPTANSPGTYTLTVTGPNGCTSTATASVIGSSELPVAAATSGFIDCKQTSDILTATSSIAGSSYVWSGPSGFSFNGSQPVVSTPGTYTVTVTATPGCTATATAILEEKTQSPDVSAEGGKLPCSPQIVDLQGFSTTPDATYTWAGPGGFTANGPQPTVSSPGIYTLTVTNPVTGCTATATASVTADVVAPMANIAAPQGLMLDCNRLQLPLEGTSDLPNVGYTWAGPNGFTANGQQPTVNAPGTYTVTVRETATGCEGVATVLVEENKTPPLNLSAQGGTLNCLADSVILGAASATPGTVYTWSGSGGFTANGQQPTVKTPGTYTLTATDPANGCTATGTATVVSDKKLPPASISPTQVQLTCTDTTATLQGTGGNGYAWSGPSGFSFSGQQPTIKTPGTYTLTVTDATNGCTADVSITVDLNQTIPEVWATGGTLSCAQLSATLSSGSDASSAEYTWAGPNGFTANGEQATVTAVGIYTVTTTNTANGCTATATASVSGDVTPPTATISTAFGTELNCWVSAVSLKAAGGSNPTWTGPAGFAVNEDKAIATKPGVYTLTVTGPNGCTGTVSATVSENKTPPVLTATGGRLECGAEPFRTTLHAEVGSGTASFEWKGPGTGPNSEVYPGAEPTVNKAGVYTVTATDQANGCTAVQQVQVDSVLVLSPGIAYSGGAVCSGGQPVGMKASAGFASYQWSNGATTDSITVNSPGVYIVTVTDAANCVGTASVTVAEGPQPTPIISGKLAFCPGEKLTLTADLTFIGYQWSNGAGSPAIEVNKEGTYTVTVTNTAGCTGTSSVAVTKLEGPTAMLTVPEDSICSGSSVTFTASGGQPYQYQYQFWVNGVAQGPFSPNSQLTLSNVTQEVTVSVRVMSGNTCQDSTVADSGPGFSPIPIVILPQPSLSTAFVTHLPTCPDDSVQVLVSLNGLPNGSYDISWQLDGGATKTAPVFFFNKLGTLVLPPLSPGQHTCTMLGVATSGTGCPTAWPSSGSTLTFNVAPPLVTTLDTTICYTQSVQIGGKTYTQTGTYTEVLQTTTGCDSTVVLQLQSVKEIEKELTMTICEGTAYDFYDQMLTKAGHYQHALPGTLGCDTLLKLTLLVGTPDTNKIERTICPGASYSVGGNVFSLPGEYEVRLKSPTSDCDSIIKLELKWPPDTLAADFANDTLRTCAGATVSLSPTVQHCSNCKYKWTGGDTLTSIFVSPTANTVYTVTVTNAVTTCTASAAVTVLVEPPYTLVADTLLCLGEKLFGKVVLRDTSITIQEACGTLTLNVEVANDPPFKAQNDELRLPLNASGPIDFKVATELLANDQPQPIATDRVLSIVRGPRLGTAAFSPDGASLTYTPPPGGAFGLDSLRYSVCPPSGCRAACDSAWVILRLQNGDLQQVQDSMPNLLTPNGDGENDVFDPLKFLTDRITLTEEEIRGARLYILNRWGEVVYRPYPYEPWDGLRGRGDGKRPLPQATYYYLLQFKIGGQQEQLRGPVNLLR